jgi:hypothetical protein
MVAAVSPFESRLEEIVRRRREIDAFEAEWFFLVGEYDRSGEWQADGHASAAAAVRAGCRMSSGEARSMVRLAKRLRHLPETAAAFADGNISRAHVVAIARSYTSERAEALEPFEHIFASAARDVDTDDLRNVIRNVTDAIDGDSGARSDDEIYAKRSLHSSKTMGGVRGDWFLDPEGGDIVKVALAAQMETASVPDDPRTLQQRRADALVDICRLSLASDHHPACAPKRRRGIPNMLGVLDIRMFEARHPALVADIRAEVAYAGRISRATLERMACDWDISRIIMDGPSEVLDLGRSTRVPSDKQFKALVARDGHCQAPGCNLPWQYCQPHHTVWWIEGGNTDLKNLKLLCSYHHRQAHNHDAQPRPG